MRFYLLLVFCFFSLKGFAEIHLEPYVGWSFSFAQPPSTQQISLSNVATQIKPEAFYIGPTAGLRLGYGTLGLSFGVDGTLANWRHDGSQITPFMAGVFASYKLPILFRIYGSLMLAHTRIKEQNLELACQTNQALKLGLSYLSLTFISINMEYMPFFLKGNENCNNWLHVGSVYLNFSF